MIIHFKCGTCEFELTTVLDHEIKIPNWINKWIEKTTCPNCGRITWDKYKEGEELL